MICYMRSKGQRANVRINLVWTLTFEDVGIMIANNIFANTKIFPRVGIWELAGIMALIYIH